VLRGVSQFFYQMIFSPGSTIRKVIKVEEFSSGIKCILPCTNFLLLFVGFLEFFGLAYFLAEALSKITNERAG